MPRPDHRSTEALAWRGFYKTAAWQHRRKAQLSVQPLCERCKAQGRIVAASVVHHVTPHKGDWQLFIAGPVASSCKPCHDSIEQSIEVRGFDTSIGVDGWPVDNNHPANVGKIIPMQRNRMSHPFWFRQVYVPLVIVTGPPGGGKSTYVNTHRGPNDLVICFDMIATMMFGRHGPSRTQASLTPRMVADVLRQRNEMLGDLMRAAARTKWPRAWLIVSEPRADRRQWWQDKLKPESIVVMLTPAAVCKQRIAKDAQAGDERSQGAISAVDTWWTHYKPRQGDCVVT